MEDSVGARRRQRLRTVFCTRGGLFGALVLRRLKACEHLEIVGVVRSSRVMNPTYGFVAGALALLRRSGIAYTLYMFCVTTLSDGLCVLFGAGAVPLATRYGLPVHTTRDINDTSGMAFLRSLEPDLLVSAFFDQKLKEPALALPRRGCLNIHPSLLPAFGGVDPVLQARLHKAQSLGVTVHVMTPVLDGGGILAQGPVNVSSSASVFETTAQLFDAGALMLVAAEIHKLRPADRGMPQGTGGSYQGWPTRDEMRTLRGSGNALLRLSDVWLMHRQSRNLARTRHPHQEIDVVR
jgi:methionyl-tRNA formyltransferase